MNININIGMMLVAGVLAAIAGTMHHFKDHIRFGGGVLSRASGGRLGGGGQAKQLYERFTAVIVLFAAATGTIGLAGSLGSVWRWAAAGTNVLALLGVTLVLAIWGWMMIVRGHRHETRRTYAVGGLLGIALALVWGGWALLKPALGKAIISAKQTATSAASGQAATGLHTAKAPGHTVTGLTSQFGTFALLAVVAGLGLVVLFSYRRRQVRPGGGHNGGGGRNGGRSGGGRNRPSIPSGHQPPAIGPGVPYSGYVPGFPE